MTLFICKGTELHYSSEALGEYQKVSLHHWVITLIHGEGQ